MRPPAVHLHPNAAGHGAVEGAQLEIGDVMRPGDVFAGRRGWRPVHERWHGEVLVTPDVLVVRPPAPRRRLLERRG